MDALLCLYDLAIPMRDGVLLRADLYRPAAEGAYPVLLIRTIFRKDWMGRCFAQYDPAFFVRRGYAVVIQDVRGLGHSEGTFSRFHADGKDGYDTIEWLAQQPFCDGNVGMMGNYYAGYLQLMAAFENPPHLKAICPAQTSVSINRDCDNRGFTFASHIGWCLSRQLNRLRDGRYDQATTARWMPQLIAWLSDYSHSQLQVSPLLDMPAAHETPFSLLAEYRRHLLEGFDDLAKLHEEGRGLDVSRIQIPAFYYCGWYDSSRTPLLQHCMVQRNIGVDSRVLIAPWRMGESPAAPDSALESGIHRVDVQNDMLRWFDHWLKGKAAPLFAPVRIADLQTDEVNELYAWPPSTSPYRLYLGSAGQLLSCAEDAFASCEYYDHDPAHPLDYHPYGNAALTLQLRNDPRRVFYESKPSQQALSVRGFVRCHLFVSSSSQDADVMVTLSDLSPDGSRFVLCDGATRLSYREDWQLRPLIPHHIYETDILLGELCCTVFPGHRLLLEVSGSAFPKYDINPGTGKRTIEAGVRIPSQQSVWHGGPYVAFLDLPILS